jgi:hypothetical protein
MRPRHLFPLLLTCFLCELPACTEGPCGGDAYVASTTPMAQGAALDAWTHSTCTHDDDNACIAGIPKGNALVLCTHNRGTLTTDGGSFLSLRCHYYSNAKSCHSSKSFDDD